jgi:hypothetical protein
VKILNEDPKLGVPKSLSWLKKKTEGNLETQYRLIKKTKKTGITTQLKVSVTKKMQVEKLGYISFNDDLTVDLNLKEIPDEKLELIQVVIPDDTIQHIQVLKNKVNAMDLIKKGTINVRCINDENMKKFMNNITPEKLETVEVYKSKQSELYMKSPFEYGDIMYQNHAYSFNSDRRFVVQSNYFNDCNFVVVDIVDISIPKTRR